MVDESDEKDRLRRVFDDISSEFSRTRQEPWDRVVEFVEGVEPTGDELSVALDLGCGNGRHLPLLSRGFDESVGIDFSSEMLNEATKKGYADGSHLARGELTRLPVRSSVVDAVLYVASLHHLPTHAERLASLGEVSRVLEPDGSALISVWAIEHSYFDEIREKDGDVYVSWGSGNENERFYHIFDESEFRELVRGSDLKLDSLETVSGNYYAVVSS
ncbi:MAG: methyltransferase domain-containing protein [Halobacteria archaeon]|nr:methyltransferase domain-containing protein [Halobacteria archaeon]